MLLDKADSKQLALLTPNKDGLGVFHLSLKVAGSSAVVCIGGLKYARVMAVRMCAGAMSGHAGDLLPDAPPDLYCGYKTRSSSVSSCRTYSHVLFYVPCLLKSYNQNTSVNTSVVNTKTHRPAMTRPPRVRRSR